MEPTAKTGNHGAISTSDSATISYYTVKLLSNKVTLHKQNRKYGKVFKAGEMLVKSEWQVPHQPEYYYHISG